MNRVLEQAAASEFHDQILGWRFKISLKKLPNTRLCDSFTYSKEFKKTNPDNGKYLKTVFTDSAFVRVRTFLFGCFFHRGSSFVLSVHVVLELTGSFQNVSNLLIKDYNKPICLGAEALRLNTLLFRKTILVDIFPCGISCFVDAQRVNSAK